MSIGYKNGQKTKARILEAAYENFLKFGYHGASLREIAAASGISHPGVRHHFETKEALLIAALAERDKRASLQSRDLIAAQGITTETLVAILRSNVETSNLGQLFIMMAAQASDPEHPAHEYFAQRYSKMRSMYAKFLTAGQRSGTVSKTVDVQRAAIQLIALVDGIQIQWTLNPNCDEVLSGLHDAVSKITFPEKALVDAA